MESEQRPPPDPERVREVMREEREELAGERERQEEEDGEPEDGGD
jgi:hypothetical protein